MHSWTEEEIQMVKSNHHKPLYEWRHLLPDRSEGSIALRARMLGLTVTQRKKESEPVSRFWKYTQRESIPDCWNWVGARNSGGYGYFSVGNERVLAHRFSWELHNGTIPSNDSYHGVCVLHKCDNRTCVNPDHLMLGTQGDNLNDMHSKKRGRHGKDKLSIEQVSEIKKLLKEGKLSMRAIADRYDVSHNTIWFIKHGKSFAHVE